jgi:hypothetical protein
MPPVTSPAAAAPSLTPTEFCKFLVEANRTASAAKSSTDGLKALVALQPRFEGHLGLLPTPLRSDASVVLSAVRDAVRTQNLNALTTDPVAQAGARLSTTCAIDGR